jgi:hypothetical protein
VHTQNCCNIAFISLASHHCWATGFLLSLVLKMFVTKLNSFVNADANLERWSGCRRIVQNQPWEIRYPGWSHKLPTPERPRFFFTGMKTQRTALGTTEGVAAALLAGSAPPIRGNRKHFSMFVVNPACFLETTHKKLALIVGVGTCGLLFYWLNNK